MRTRTGTALLALAGVLGCEPTVRDEAPRTAASSSQVTSADAGPLATLLMDFWPGSDDGLPSPDLSSEQPSLLTFRNRVLFSVNGPTNGGLWQSDGTLAGTGRLQLTLPLAGATELGDRLYVMNEHALWSSDLTSAATLVLDFPEATYGSKPFRFGDRLAFNLWDSEYGPFPWSSDGTTAGTLPFPPLRSDGRSPAANYFTEANGLLFFGADDGVHDYELWRSDGTAAGTRLVKDIHPTGSPFFVWGDSSGHADLYGAGATLYFAANDSVHGKELWRSDGTAEGTFLVKELVEGPDGGGPEGFCLVQHTVFFRAFDPTHHFGLWKTDGTAQGTVLVSDVGDFAVGSDSPPSSLRALGSRVVFIAPGPRHSNALWASDGTEAGTVLVADVPVESDRGHSFKVLDGLLFFRADDGEHGFEPWRSDGTPEGTYMLDDVAPGAYGSQAGHFAVAGRALLFRASTPATGYELWTIPLSKAHHPGPLTITCPADVSAWTGSEEGTVVTYPPAEAHDESGAVPTVTYSHPSGSVFPVGTTDVVATATDSSQNSAKCSFRVEVALTDGAEDGGTPDAGAEDAGAVDAGEPEDAGAVDAGGPAEDAGTPDGGTIDAGEQDAGVAEPPTPEPPSGCSTTSGTGLVSLLALAGSARRQRRSSRSRACSGPPCPAARQ